MRAKFCNFVAMKTGIIVAMKAEMERLLPLIDQHTTETANGTTFHLGKIGTTEVAAMQCGIGKVNAAVGALTLIERYSPEVVINTGIAGATGNGASILDVVVAEEVAYHDVWCGPGNVRGQVQGLPPRFSCTRALPSLESVLRRPEVKHGLIASGDMFVDTAAELQRILSIHPDAIAVDMESGAIAQVCAMKNVPFLAIRVVSDQPGSENHLEQYENFWDLAPEATFEVMRSLLP